MFSKLYEKLISFIKSCYKEIIFIIFIIFISFVHLPFVIYKTGGSINLNKRISGIDSFFNGSYSMNYVSVVKGNIPALFVSIFMKNWDIKKQSDISIYDYNTLFKLEQLDLKDSLYKASYVAYQKAGKTITTKDAHHYITLVSEDSKTNLKVLDEIKLIDGNKFNELKEFQEYVKSKNIGDKIIFTLANGKEKYAYVKDFEGEKKVGIAISTNYDYEIDPEINIKTKSSEAGSSGGLMLSLAIYDYINSEDIAKGKNVMGTGTISLDGTIGEIGGVKYKMLGAQNDGADIFFVPEKNYEEAKKVYKDNNFTFSLVMVKTFDDALNYLKNN